MDILDKLVELTQITGRIDVQCRFQENWYFREESKKTQGLAHIVISGKGYLKIDGQEEIRLLQAGDAVFFPRIKGHVISSRKECDNIEDVPEQLQNGAFVLNKKCGSKGRQMDLFCAHFEYDSKADLISSLPEVIHVGMRHASLDALVGILEYESERQGEGSATVVNALSSVLLVLLMRTYLAQEGKSISAGVLNGWYHPRLRGVVQAVMSAPDQPWSIQDMVGIANVSRAQLMRLFKQQIGVSPYAFVNSIRLQQAAVLLKRSADSILSVALSVGFQSETHFGKVFKKQYGVSPGQYRKSRGHVENPA